MPLKTYKNTLIKRIYDLNTAKCTKKQHKYIKSNL